MKSCSRDALASTKHERRMEYRLHYPVGLRPLLKIKNRLYAVLDISECGVRFAGPVWSGDLQGQFEASVQFHAGSEYKITGEIVRTTAGDSAGRLVEGFDFHLILQQHDWVMRAI